jgi:hypothetical protein
MTDEKRDDQQSDAEIVEQERARTEALEYGQDEVLDDAPEADGDGVVPAGPVP